MQQTQEPTPQRPDDKYTRQAEATIFAIADDRRRAAELQEQNTNLHKRIATLTATVDQQIVTIKEKDDEIARQRALVDSWQHQAAFLQSAIEVGARSLLQAVGSDAATVEGA